MTRVVGIRFQKAGKIYYFDPCDFDLETGMHAIVETARGVEMGTVLLPPREVEDEKVIQPLKPVIRIATDEDEKIVLINKEKEKEAFEICKEKILKHGLEMKLVNAEYTFDNNKLLFYFTADGRIDFRELVKDLAAVFRTRIELRQIGVRDETKILGGIGICGRPLCCKTYLSDFVPVSIKMAKEQNLSLNPTKISGVCGRLMCCLKNEQDTYEYLNSRLPSVGDVVYTKDGIKGEVQTVNVLRQQVKLVVDNGEEKELREYKVEELNFRPKKRKDVKITEEELKELEGLEDEEVVEEVPERREKPNRKFNKERPYNKERSYNKDNSSKDSYSKEFSNKEFSNKESNNREDSNKEFNKENYHREKFNKEKFNREKFNRDNYNKENYNKENFSNAENGVESNNQIYGENTSTNENGETRHYKKRYDGKGKRYFGKNKKRYNNPNNSSEKQ